MGASGTAVDLQRPMLYALLAVVLLTLAFVGRQRQLQV